MKKQKYLDLPYKEKRKILRKFYNDNAKVYEIVHYVISSVGIKTSQVQLLLNLLIDGYVAFEKNDNEYKTIDVTSLNIDELLKMKNSNTYFIYNDLCPYIITTSLVEQIMFTKLTKKDENIIRLISNNIIENFLNKIKI